MLRDVSTHLNVATGGDQVPRCGQASADGRAPARTRYTRDAAQVTCRKCLAALGLARIARRSPERIAADECARYLGFMREAASRGDVNVQSVLKAALALPRMAPADREAARADMLAVLDSVAAASPPKWRSARQREQLLALARGCVDEAAHLPGRFELERFGRETLAAAARVCAWR